ncbi:hypothetical protein NW756_010052 [Fusarium oxysporum]|nr:hypothetical protein NW763_003583 [Fusarium oxysporum]KAJ4067700.1 hypothetical protein NW753_002764 [Fusarium oxysporum]KAJ4082363.1 hypothetical protein NW756_010052 [Fusarium oxysporum]KAJ4108529.1 hypothetical protein NW769_008457 [Fusarium oxysporum]KAJ4237720.1 hypothetical protein NW760_003155 [Fusarium oxysporum]
MILLGLLSCVGPAMSDAISNLGGGGLSTPYLANLATSLNYTAGCLLTLFGGPLINKFGIKWSCIIAAVGMPLSGSAYYVCAKYRVNWYLIFAKIMTGFTYGFLYVAESTAMLSYPLENDRGFYLGVWSAMRNSGSVIGGAINFSNNHSDSKAGGVAWSTYLVFIAFECTGLVWAFLLSPTRRVQRHDSTKVPISERASWTQEFSALWKHLQRRKAACFIWIGIEYAKFGRRKLENALDYETNTRRWAEAYLPYLIMQSTSYVCQLSLYWILGTFSTNAGSSARSGGLLRAFETAGQTVSYAINSHSDSDARFPFYVHAAILCLTVPCMVFLIRLVPEAPAATDIDAEPVIEGVLDNKQVT